METNNKIIDESLEVQYQDLQNMFGWAGVEFEIQEDCDVIENAEGEFGRSCNNPIPVNGTTGELKYLHRMRCQCGAPFYFHRLGSKSTERMNGSVDIYECVCYGSEHWEILYFHMYHPRRSTKAPVGLTFSEFNEMLSTLPLVIGTNKYVDDFPFGLSSYVYEFLGEELKDFADKVLEDYEASMKIFHNKFIRTEEHRKKLEKIFAG